jgi:hypothetical protein
MRYAQLPNIRVISTPVANVILLRCIGSQLRAHYGDLMNHPIPAHLHDVIRRLP